MNIKVNSPESITLLIVIITLGILYLILHIESPIIIKAGSFILTLIVSGFLLGKIWSLNTSYGIILLRSKWLISEIDKISKRFKEELTFFADTALVLGLGLFGVYILYKNCDKIRTLRAAFTGLTLLVITVLFILPVVNQLVPYVVKGIDYSKAYQQTERNMPEVVITISRILFLVGGFTFSYTFSLIYYGLSVVINVFTVLFGGGEPFEPTSTAIIPGVSIPLVEGIIALIFLLFVHEVSHGLLSRVANVSLSSVGIVFFGVLPMGAFVEPDEEELEKKDVIQKIRVFIAGSGANFMLMFISFICFMFFQSIITPHVQYYGVYVGNVSEYYGSTVMSVDGIPIDKLDFEHLPYSPGDTVNITTEKGTFTVKVNENGKVGIIRKMKITDPLLLFLFNTLSLFLVLNFFVAAFNLIPIFLLDGYHIFRTIFGEEKVRYLSYILIASLLATFLPWLWK